MVLTVSESMALQNIEGKWLEATRGCNISLTENELQDLIISGGNTYFAHTELNMNNGSYNVTLSDGDGCREPGVTRDVSYPDGNVLRCGHVSSSKGSYFFNETQGKYNFRANTSGSHYYGRSVRILNIEILLDNILRISHSTRTCKNMIKYFIKSPESLPIS